MESSDVEANYSGSLWVFRYEGSEGWPDAAVDFEVRTLSLRRCDMVLVCKVC